MNEQDIIFSTDSFDKGITSKEEAHATYKYFTSNLSKLRTELVANDYGYTEQEKYVKACWASLFNACKVVGYTNNHLQYIKALYGL